MPQRFATETWTPEQPALLRVAELEDVGAQAETLPGWSQRYRQLGRGRWGGRLRYARIGPVDVFQEESSRAMLQQTAGPGGSLALAVVLPGAEPAHAQGEAIAAGGALVVAGERMLDFACHGRMDLVALVLRPDAGLVAPDLPSGPLACPEPSAFATLQQGLLQGLEAAGAGLAAQQALACGRSLAVAALRCLPPPRAIQPSARARAALVARLIRRVEAAPEEAPDPVEMAQEAGVALRVLELAFKEVLGCSPQGYVRAIRLNAARVELRRQRGNPLVTVASVAAYFGFWHFGRFAAAYRALFGESPAETLHPERRRR